jgi:hypothetical protein
VTEKQDKTKDFPEMKVRIKFNEGVGGQNFDRMIVDHRPGCLESFFICDDNGVRNVRRGQMVLQLKAGSSPATGVSNSGGWELNPISADDEKRLLGIYDEVMKSMIWKGAHAKRFR